MKKSCPRLAPLIFLMIASSAFADQLAWNSRGDSEKAVKAIKPQSLLVSYCSLADKVHVEVWLIEKAEVVDTDEKGFGEIRVSGRKLFRSMKSFKSGEYAEPVGYQAFQADDKSAVLDKKIDLAYVYAPTDDGTFQCLGKALKLDCEVKVEKISLPKDVREQALKMIEELKKTTESSAQKQ